MKFQTTAAIAALLALASTAQATNLVQNGGFETTTIPGSYGFGSLDPQGNQAAHWSTTGYNFIFAPGTADTTGAQGEYGFLSLWGPNNGGAASNMLPATSPDGGNFVAADGAYQTESIDQTITGLTANTHYLVSFDWAGAQQSGYTGATTEQWTVSLGSQSISTAVAQNVNHGFTGWMHETFNFTATSGTETLSFLAHGTPNGEPPFSLLDGVSLSAVPEPASWSLMILGVGALGAVSRRRRIAAVAA